MKGPHFQEQIIHGELERLASLRMQMLEMHPFWGYLLLQMRIVPAPGLPVFSATDCIRHIWFNPFLTRKLEMKELGFVLAHEVCHQIFATQERRGEREIFKWNMATDYAINAMVSDITIPGSSSTWIPDRDKLYQMPEGCLLNPKYQNWIAEVIYEDLCRTKNQGTPLIREISLPFENEMKLPLPAISDHRGGIDIHLPVDLNENEKGILQKRVLEAIDVYEASSSRGDFPEGMLMQLGLLSPPEIPWQRVLHHYVDTLFRGDDYSLARPNKRYLLQDLLVPGHYSETISRMVVALDRSGSMSKEKIQDVVKEIRGMVPHAEDVTLIVADCVIQQVIASDELETFLESASLSGGGGTDHHCVFEYIETHHLQPRVFIGLTDLHTLFPEKKPSYPVLWLVPEAHGEAPWGKVIEV